MATAKKSAVKTVKTVKTVSASKNGKVVKKSTKPVEAEHTAPVVDEAVIKDKLGEAYRDFLTLQKMLQRQDANNIRFYHELGQKWSACHKRYERNQGLIKNMTKYLGVDRTLIYDAQRFADRIEDSELQAYVEARTASGRSLTWSHVRLIIGASHKADRLKAVEMVVDNNWSASQLNKYMTEVNETKSNRKGNSGRKMRQPASVSQGVGMFREAGEAFIRRYEEVFQPFISKTTDSITVDDVSEDMLNQFTAVLDQQRAIKQMAEDNIGIIEKIIERVRELLDERTSAEEAAAAAEAGGTVPVVKKASKEAVKARRRPVSRTEDSEDVAEETEEAAAPAKSRRRLVGAK